MENILIIHGPNLNLLGTRQPEIYGYDTLDMINQKITQEADALNIKITTYQSNIEGEIINQIQHAKHQKIEYIVINAAGLTLAGHSLLDALTAVQIPFVEVHQSNIYARPDKSIYKSLLSPYAKAVIAGMGTDSYIMGTRFAVNQLQAN